MMTLPSSAYRIIEAQQNEMSFEAPFVVGVSERAFSKQIHEWLSLTGLIGPVSDQVAPASASEALKMTLQRTGWSFRGVGSTLGIEHTEVRRILNKERSPRDGVARRIFDLETLTRHLNKIVNGNQQRVRLALETTPVGRHQTAAAIVHLEHNLPRAMMYASEVLFPRLEMPELAPSSLYLDDAIVDIDGA
jgi:hypothetical protein